MINYGLYNGLYDNQVEPKQNTWEWMVDFLSKHDKHVMKDAAPLIGFQSWKELPERETKEDFMTGEAIVTPYPDEGEDIIGGVEIKYVEGEAFVLRRRENVLTMSCLAIDYDDHWTIKQALTHYRDFEFVLYTSHSHQSAGIDRFRMVFPLVVPIPFNMMMNPNELRTNEETVYPDLHSVFHNTGDASWSNLGRVVFTPSAPPERIHLAEFHHNKGIFMDWRELNRSSGTIKVKKPLTRLQKMKLKTTHKGSRSVQWETFNLEKACQAAGIILNHRGKWIDIECPWAHMHHNATKKNHSSISYNGEKWSFKCQHQSHGNKTAYDLKQHLLDTIGDGQWKNMIQYCDGDS